MTTAKQAQAKLNQVYGATMQSLDAKDPVAAAIIREFVSALRYEAAGYRRETHRLRCELELHAKGIDR